jgi:hypothetical protein
VFDIRFSVEAKDELKKTDKGRLRQAKSSFPDRTWWWWEEILCLSQELACGGEAALTETMGRLLRWRECCDKRWW